MRGLVLGTLLSLIVSSCGGLTPALATEAGVQPTPRVEETRPHMKSYEVTCVSYPRIRAVLMAGGYVPIIASMRDTRAPNSVIGGDMIAIYMHGNGSSLVFEVDTETDVACVVATGVGAVSPVFQVGALLGRVA